MLRCLWCFFVLLACTHVCRRALCQGRLQPVCRSASARQRESRRLLPASLWGTQSGPLAISVHACAQAAERAARANQTASGAVAMKALPAFLNWCSELCCLHASAQQACTVAGGQGCMAQAAAAHGNTPLSLMLLLMCELHSTFRLGCCVALWRQVVGNTLAVLCGASLPVRRRR